MPLKPAIASLDRLHRDADAAGWHELAKLYKKSRDRLITDQLAWELYARAFQACLWPNRRIPDA
jgi:hypothetical protein